jgi:hypothetical protein
VKKHIAIRALLGRNQTAGQFLFLMVHPGLASRLTQDLVLVVTLAKKFMA